MDHWRWLLTDVNLQAVTYKLKYVRMEYVLSVFPKQYTETIEIKTSFTSSIITSHCV